MTMGWVLFETTESVIEVLWDIALAFFIVRLGFIYFFFNFISSMFVSWLASTNATHFTTIARAELWLVPFLTLVSGVWARWMIRWYEVPRVASFRIAIGAVALVLTFVAESVVGFVLYEEGRGDWIVQANAQIAAGYAAVLAVVGLMPWLQMVLFEHGKAVEPVEKTQHGHENKSLVDAV
jgi:hypothetical protein